jgi:trk/ktr system potassium uptake protein
MGIDWIITAAMVVGGLPFVHLVALFRGGWRPLLRDSQVHWYLTILVLALLSVTAWLWLVDKMPAEMAVTQASFNVVSVMTGTGYATADFNNWGGMPLVVILTLMFVGGCAGSTTCGIKVFRFQVAYAVARIQIARLLQPHGVFIASYNRRPITEEIAGSVMGFFFLFVASFAVLAGILGLTGLDFITSISGAATAIANVGPGLGSVIGPEGNFSSLPDAAKLALTGGMLLGRLELYTILILFAPAFWRG